MQLSLTPQERKVFIQRRQRIAQQLNGSTALITSGLPQVRNFRANVYNPFRASSHFLYVVGLHIPHAACIIDEKECLVFMPTTTVNDALWHGSLPSFKEIADHIGCEVRDVKQLPHFLASRTVCVLPQGQLNTAQQQQQWIGRAFDAQHDAPLIDAIVHARLIHDELALDQWQKAMDITCQAHHEAMQKTTSCHYAYQVKAHMEYVAQQAHLVPSYAPIVTPRGQVLHNHDYYDQLQADDLLLVDFGVESPLGYATDVTRTWPVNGQWSPTQLAVYQLVLEALNQCTQHAQVGVEYKMLHAKALQVMTQGLIDLGILQGNVEEVLEANSAALFFPHGIGHLLGLDVHDMEDLGDVAGYESGRVRDQRFSWKYLRLNRPLQANMVITIEPGFYQVQALLENPSFVSPTAGQHVNWNVLSQFKDVKGIRIEDDILIQNQGPVILSQSIHKEARKIEQYMQE